MTKTQIITKNDVQAFNFFVSTESLQTIATLASKAVTFIDELVNQGKLLPGVGDEAKKVLDYISKYGMPAAICNEAGGSAGETQSGWLHNLRDLLISPAYAATANGCQLYFNRALGNLTVGTPAYEAARQAIVDQAYKVLTPDNVALYNTLQAALDNGTITSDQQIQLNQLKPFLYTAANVFAVCGNENDVSNLTNLLTGVQSHYNSMLLAEALDFRRGGNLMASEITNKDPAALAFWNQYNQSPETMKFRKTIKRHPLWRRS